MCGIVGLFLKNKALEPELGTMLSGMLATMCDRGPDSAGFAVYGSGDSGHVKLTLRATSPSYDFAGLATRLSKAVGAPVSVEVRDSHGVFIVPEGFRAGSAALHRGAGRRRDDRRLGHAHGDLQGGRPSRRGRQALPSREDVRLARHCPYPHGDRSPRSPPMAPILSRRAATSASCITARSPITTRFAVSSSATAFPSRRTTTRKSPRAISPGASARATASAMR